MANNNEKDEKKAVADPELERALKSMGGRIDSDPIPPVEEKKEETPAPVLEPKPEDKKDITPDNGSGKPKGDEGDNKNISRPEKFIPLAKYHSEQREYQNKIADLEKKVTELSEIATKTDGAGKDKDIEEFMEKTGFDKETVEGLLNLAEKRIMKPELAEALKKADDIVKENEIQESFATEFKTDGEKNLKKHFPNITETQLAKAKTFLDQVAHTKEFYDKKLDYVIFENLEGLKNSIGIETSTPTPDPVTKKTLEPNKMGSGKVGGLSAKDFAGIKDFSTLNDMDPATRNTLISSFDNATYQNFYQWTKAQGTGLEVMRNGQKVILK